MTTATDLLSWVSQLRRDHRTVVTVDELENFALDADNAERAQIELILLEAGLADLDDKETR